MTENVRKLTVDWEKKVTLTEARATYQALHDTAVIRASGTVPPLV